MLMPTLESNEKKRRAAILHVASQDIELGFLFAFFNFEWFLRRMILVFSKCPTVVVRARLVCCHGFGDYCELWNECVCKFDEGIISLAEILGKSETESIKQYCTQRHVLVHGARGGIGFATAICGISRLLKALEALVEYAQKNGKNLFIRLYHRQNVRCGFIPKHGIESFKNGKGECLCPAELKGECPFCSSDKERRKIICNIKKSRQPVDELARVKGKALVEKVRNVAEELGLANKASIKKAICDLEKNMVKCNSPLILKPKMTK